MAAAAMAIRRAPPKVAGGSSCHCSKQVGGSHWNAFAAFTGRMFRLCSLFCCHLCYT